MQTQTDYLDSSPFVEKKGTIDGIDFYVVPSNECGKISKYAHMLAEMKEKYKKPFELPTNLYVADFPSGQDILINRQVVGLPLYRNTAHVGHSVLKAFMKQFPALLDGIPLQVVIMSGGRPLDLNDGNIYPYLVNTMYFRIKRRPSETMGNKDFVAERKDGMLGNAVWPHDVCYLVDECSASGRTYEKAAEEIFRRHRPKKIVLFPICGSIQGVAIVNSLCRKYDVELIPIFNSGIYGVGEDLTELSGLNPLSLVTKAFYEKLFKKFQGRTICNIGDYGDRIWLPMLGLRDYLLEMILFDCDPKLENWLEWWIHKDLKYMQALKRFLLEGGELVDNGTRKVISPAPQAWEYLKNGFDSLSIQIDTSSL